MLLGFSLHNFTCFRNFHIGLTAKELLETLSPRKPEDPAVGEVSHQNLPHLPGAADLAHLPDLANVAPLRNLTVLIGKNGSGKTMLFKALHLISDILTQGIAQATSEHFEAGFTEIAGNSGSFAAELIFYWEKEYSIYYLRFIQDALGRPHLDQERLQVIRKRKGAWKVKELLAFDGIKGRYLDEKNKQYQEIDLQDRKYTALSILGRMRGLGAISRLYLEMSDWYIPELDPEFTRSTKRDYASLGQGIFVSEGGHKHLKVDCSNAANVILYYRTKKKENFDHFLERVGKVMMEFTRGTGKRLLAEGKVAEISSFLNRLATGKRKLFYLLLMLEDSRHLVCLEEPDASLHYSYIGEAALAFREYVMDHPDRQIFLTTQNNYMLDAFAPEEVWILRENAWAQAGATSLSEKRLVVNMCQEGIGLGTQWYNGYFEE